MLKNTKLILTLPRHLKDIRQLIEAVNWDKMQKEIGQEVSSTVAIVGPVNAGKSTLFNSIEGGSFSKTASKPGTTKQVYTRQLGPFSLMDTPGFGENREGGLERAAMAFEAARTATLVILVLDGTQGIRSDDLKLYKQVKDLGRPVLVVLNKIDLLGRQLDPTIHEAAHKLGTEVVPISALEGTNVASHLVPRILGAYPELAVAIGRQLPNWRKMAAQKVVRRAALANATLGLEPIPGLDIPFLIATQTKMILRIAAIYGESLNIKQAKELITTIAGGLLVRYVGEEVSKAIPFVGWVAAAGIAAAGTYAMGQVAIQYFENGKTVPVGQMRSLYKQLRKTKIAEIKREDELAGTVGPEIYIPPLAQSSL